MVEGGGGWCRRGVGVEVCVALGVELYGREGGECEYTCMHWHTLTHTLTQAHRNTHTHSHTHTHTHTLHTLHFRTFLLTPSVSIFTSLSLPLSVSVSLSLSSKLMSVLFLSLSHCMICLPIIKQALNSAHTLSPPPPLLSLSLTRTLSLSLSTFLL